LQRITEQDSEEADALEEAQGGFKLFQSSPNAQKPNLVDCGCQTAKAHFDKISQSSKFQRQEEARLNSTDYKYSPLMQDLQFAKSTNKR
jgi:hypothetical protein